MAYSRRMPRQARNAPGGLVYHVLNRANGRLRLFKKEDDFTAFERVLKRAHEQVPMRILSWCIMSNHWHLVLWPREDGETDRVYAEADAHARTAVEDGAQCRGPWAFVPGPVQEFSGAGG